MGSGSKCNGGVVGDNKKEGMGVLAVNSTILNGVATEGFIKKVTVEQHLKEVSKPCLYLGQEKTGQRGHSWGGHVSEEHQGRQCSWERSEGEGQEWLRELAS